MATHFRRRPWRCGPAQYDDDGLCFRSAQRMAQQSTQKEQRRHTAVACRLKLWRMGSTPCRTSTGRSIWRQSSVTRWLYWAWNLSTAQRDLPGALVKVNRCTRWPREGTWRGRGFYPPIGMSQSLRRMLRVYLPDFRWELVARNAGDGGAAGCEVGLRRR